MSAREQSAEPLGVADGVTVRIVVEVGVDGCPFRTVARDALGPGRELGVEIAPAGAQPAVKADVGPGGRTDERGMAASPIRETQSGVVCSQESIDGFAVPRVMAELERMPVRSRQYGEEGGQALPVAGELGRELPEDGARRGPQGGEMAEEALHRLGGILEALEVRDEAAPLGREEEARRHLGLPGGEGLARREAVEGVVDLDGIEVGAVVLQPAPRGQLARVEHASPVWVVPA